MTLEDRVLYRAVVDLLTLSLPDTVTKRMPFEDFKRAPIIERMRYISKADVAAYYEFVDHAYLAEELISQTGEEPAVDALADLLGRVMGRRIGLPQVNTASNVLGDTYIDMVRRRLVRRGYAVFTYSDDFRIASRTLADAREALEACAEEVRVLGLVLNERKTYTYGARKYEASLTSFAKAERSLFAADQGPEGDQAADPFALGTTSESYDAEERDTSTLGASPLDRGIDDSEAFDEAALGVTQYPDSGKASAARRAWQIWENEDESEETQAGQDAVITQSLLGLALPILGAVGDAAPIESLSLLLRFEPGLAPHVAAYIAAYARHGLSARGEIRQALNDVVEENIFSPWQGMWLAQAAGELPRTRREQTYERWLTKCVSESHHDGLTATAAASLGRLGRKKNADVVAAAVERVSAPWKRLAFWGILGLDSALADRVADDGIDRLLIAATLS
jgi:hypothetical protein